MSNIIERNTVVNTGSYNKSKPLYNMNDLSCVFTHYDKTLGKNIPTENKLNGGNNSGKGIK